MELTLSIFQRRRTRHYEWHTLGLGRFTRSWQGANLAKVESGLTDALRRALVDAFPENVEPLEMVFGRKLEVVSLSFSMPSGGSLRRIHGKFPLVVEPRSRGPGVSGGPLVCVYHPLRPDEWFALPQSVSLADAAGAYFRTRWAAVEDEDLAELAAHNRDRLRVLSLSIKTKNLRAKLEKKKPDPGALIGGGPGKKGAALLTELAVDETRRAIDGRLPSGMSRPHLRERIAPLICGRRRVSVLLVGASGTGKSMLVRQLVHDLLASDDYPSHRNYDKLHPVFRLTGRRIIAGMSYLGQWEKRCVDVVEAARSLGAVLWVEDIHAWGRLGESRESERSLATFFRGPVARAELALVAECTAEQYQQLVDDAPTFADAFTTLFIDPTNEAETMAMLVHEARMLEIVHRVAFDPRALKTIYDLAGTLGSGTVYPGRAVDLLRSMATGDDARSLDLRHAESEARAGRKIGAIKAYRTASGHTLRAAKVAVETFMEQGVWPQRATGAEAPPMVVRSALAADFYAHAGPAEIGPRAVVRRLAERTGMPVVLLDPTQRLSSSTLRGQIQAQIMGQAEAVESVVDLIVRIKAGLTDPSRPWGVLLFTGPTGTGKTEMAKCLAEYLYGATARLLRFDMSEFSDPGAAARLIGDRFRPEGVLTTAVRLQPFSVVLLDEVEKADPSVLGLMLQLFDDGRLTDAAGNVVDFTHTVVVMTSNLGAQTAPSVGFGQSAVASTHDVGAAVREFFPPELFNRIDRVVPFTALSTEAATEIARRELERLLTRRGLTERNIFVRFTDAVVEGVVAKAFDPRYGARSLKRWLEDHVGAWLADEIAGQPLSGLRVLWLHQREGVLRLHPELLLEAEVMGNPGPFEAMLDWNATQLRGQVPSAVAGLDAILDSERLVALSDKLRENLAASVRGDGDAADAVFNLEGMRGELLSMRESLATQVDYDPRIVAAGDVDMRAQHEGELIEVERFGRMRIGADRWSGEMFVRILGAQPGGPVLPMQRRPDFVNALAAYHFIGLAIATADDPDQHTALIELTRVTRPDRAGRFAREQPGLLEWLAEAYVAGRGALDAHACEPAEAGALFSTAAERRVVRIVGPAVAAFFQGEHGSHVRTSLAAGAEVVRVRVLSSAVSPKEHLGGLQRERTEFVEALESGEPLPENPDALLPILRRYRFDPSPGSMSKIEVEDYPLAYAIETRARSLSDVLPHLWLLRVGQRAATEQG